MKTQNLRRRTTMLAATLSAIMVPALAHADDGVEAGSDGLSVKTGDLELNLGGRLHLDATVFDHGLDDGSEADESEFGFAGADDDGEAVAAVEGRDSGDAGAVLGAVTTARGSPLQSGQLRCLPR